MRIRRIVAGVAASGATRCAVAAAFVVAVFAAAEPAAAQQRLTQDLALQTFDSAWSRIAHTHYDTAFGGVDWHAVRDELRPKAATAATLPQLRAVIGDMLDRLGESHYGLIPNEAVPAVEAVPQPPGGSGDTGMEMRLLDGQLLVWRLDPTGPAAAAGVRTGWRVVAIDGRNVAERIEPVLALPAAEQRTARTRLLYQLNALLNGAPGTDAEVTLERSDGTVQPLRIVRRQAPGEVVRYGNLPAVVAELRSTRVTTANGCVGVIRLNIWMVPLSAAFDSAVDRARSCAGVVIDLRGNPGGVAGMVMGTAGHFINDTLPLGFLQARGNSPIRFKANPRRVGVDGRAVEPFAGPVAVLVDEMSASTSEFFAAGMQGVGRARVFGSNSAGQALPAAMVRLPTGDVLMHVMANFTGPGAVRIEGRGVVPDVVVRSTRQDLLNGRDAVLEAALDWIAGARAGTHPTGGIQR